MNNIDKQLEYAYEAISQLEDIYRFDDVDSHNSEIIDCEIEFWWQQIEWLESLLSK